LFPQLTVHEGFQGAASSIKHLKEEQVMATQFAVAYNYYKKMTAVKEMELKGAEEKWGSLC